jgi:hypothetical protein
MATCGGAVAAAAPPPEAAACALLRLAKETPYAAARTTGSGSSESSLGLWSVAAHRHLMDMFRLVYRARFVEPLVIGLFLFQLASGAVLLWSYVGRPTDFFRTLQIATGAYLFFYVLGHMNSVLVARAITKVQTDWDWAIGAPAGLIHGAWSIRLLPHYLTGVFFVLMHVVLGARVIALAHHMPPERADLLAKTGIAISAVVAVAIIVRMSGFHLAN